MTKYRKGIQQRKPHNKRREERKGKRKEKYQVIITATSTPSSCPIVSTLSEEKEQI
jgi:hypothetical protein